VLAAPEGGLAGAAYRLAPLGLAFHDPFQVGSVPFGARVVSLAADRSTHLALLASQERFSAEAIQGVIAGAFTGQVEPGLFMFRPYATGKIPLVFVHGLAATPLAFLQAFNEFQNDPELSARYQFWVFLYPTGRPIVRSAQWLRQELERAHAAYGSDPAFHRMVLVGHSLGGVLAHMVASDSGREVWDSTLALPPQALRASPASRALLEQVMFFHPLPYLRRVVFIATPHRGSPLATSVIGRYYTGRIRASAEQTALVADITAWNGPGVITDQTFRGESINAISNLRVDSPLLQAVARLPVAPGVRYHTIAFQFAGHASHDLVVPLWSAHLHGASSEAILPGNHGSEQSPAALRELRCILLEHLAAP
jgi:pimeloyl-ACP methyl ester carboxylesterase